MEQREGEGGAGTRGLEVGWTLRGMGRLWGSRVAFRLTPALGSPSHPFPGSGLPLSAVLFSSPWALSAPAPGSVRWIEKKEGGEGKGRRRKEDAPCKGGCWVSALDPPAKWHAPSRPLSPGFSFSRRRGRPRVVWSAHARELASPCHGPWSPPPVPRLSLPPFH